MAEEKQGILALHALLRLEREITTQLLQGLLGRDFSRVLTFYLQKHNEYLYDLEQITSENVHSQTLRHVRHEA